MRLTNSNYFNNSLFIQIKFLKTKEGTAMVQMGDSVAVERCVQHLNNIPVGSGGKIQIAYVRSILKRKNLQLITLLFRIVLQFLQTEFLVRSYKSI